MEKWRLLDFISNESLLNKLSRLNSGTLVLWESLDRIVGNSNKENDTIRKVFLEEFNLMEKHLGMVFHKYMDKKGSHKLKIWINGHLVEGWDPFLLKHSELCGIETYEDGKINVKCFVLPHMSKFQDEKERERAGGPKGWYEQQGFYIYRNDRLLVAGDWLNLFPRNEHSKLARVSIDFSNDLDHEWSLDIKKSTAKPPARLRKDLERLGKKVRKESGRVYGYRGTVLRRDPNLPDFEFEKIWEAVKSQDGSIDYRINTNHSLLKKILSQTTITQKELKKLLKVVEENIPVETIIYYQSEDPSLHELRSSGKELNSTVIELAKEVFDSLISQGVKKELALKQLLNIEPFNQYDQLTAYF